MPSAESVLRLPKGPSTIIVGILAPKVYTIPLLEPFGSGGLVDVGGGTIQGRFPGARKLNWGFRSSGGTGDLVSSL